MSVHFRNKLYKTKIPQKIRLYQLRYFLLSFSGNLPSEFNNLNAVFHNIMLFHAEAFFNDFNVITVAPITPIPKARSTNGVIANVVAEAMYPYAN